MKAFSHRLAILLGLCLGMGTPALAVNLEAALSETPPKRLSEYGLFADLSGQIPAEGVVPYDLATPLFTDYAVKLRFVAVPEGMSAPYSERGALDFPVGTILVKTFAYPDLGGGEEGGLHLVETRLLIHQASGWLALPFVWNAEQTDAVLKRAGKTLTVMATLGDGSTQEIRYAVPNVNQCKGCHVSNGTMTPIGPKARNLNRDFDYADGTENQLTHWERIGFLGALPASPAELPRTADWLDADTTSLVDRARAYLDVNCAHCHSPVGPGKTSGLFLEWEETNASHLGILKRPVAAGRGSGGLDFDIVPGDPDNSILLFRMDSVDPGIMMPELGRGLVHTEGIALIREWISSLEE